MPSILSRLHACAPPGLFDVLPSISSIVFESHDWPGYIRYRLHIGSFTDPSDVDTTPQLPVWAYLSLKASRVQHYPTRVILELGANKDDPTDPAGDREITWDLYYENIRHYDPSDIGDEMIVLEGVFAEEKSRSDLVALVKYYFLLAKEVGMLSDWDGNGIPWCASWEQTMKAICRRVKRHEERKRAACAENESERHICLYKSTIASSGDDIGWSETGKETDTEVEEMSVASRASHVRPGIPKRNGLTRYYSYRPKCANIALSEYLARRQRYEEQRATPQDSGSSFHGPKSAQHLPKIDPLGRAGKPRPRPFAPKPDPKRQYRETRGSPVGSDQDDSNVRRGLVLNARSAERLARTSIGASKNATLRI